MAITRLFRAPRRVGIPYAFVCRCDCGAALEVVGHQCSDAEGAARLRLTGCYACRSEQSQLLGRRAFERAQEKEPLFGMLEEKQEQPDEVLEPERAAYFKVAPEQLDYTRSTQCVLTVMKAGFTKKDEAFATGLLRLSMFCREALADGDAHRYTSRMEKLVALANTLSAAHTAKAPPAARTTGANPS
jgi:hypothetical protein